MHREILSNEQINLLPLVKTFYREFYLVGATAIALQTGHRRSVDFDLFKNKLIRPKAILSKISESGFSYDIYQKINRTINYHDKR